MKIKKLNESKLVKEGLQPADEWYLKVNPGDTEGAAELKGLFIDDVIKDKGNLDKYGFSDRLKGILDNQFKRYSPVVAKESKSIKTLGAKGKKLNETKESGESELITKYLNNGEFDKLEKVNNGTNVVWKLKEPVEEKSLTEGARPSQATLDDCLEYYLNNAFGYDGVEDYVDTEFPNHSAEFKAEVANYIKERKHLDEGATQYGVHQFSTDSIIFRGTEEECGEYIDNNQKLWKDAEVYRMEPGDPHYTHPKHITENVNSWEPEIISAIGTYVLTTGHKDWDNPEKIAKGSERAIIVKYRKGSDSFTVGGVNPNWVVHSSRVKFKTYDDARAFIDFHLDEYGSYKISKSRFDDTLVSIPNDYTQHSGVPVYVSTHFLRKEAPEWYQCLPDEYKDEEYTVESTDCSEADLTNFSSKDSGTLTENAQGEGKYSDVFHRYLEWLQTEGKEDNIAYLASQLIRYCPEEDLKDLWYDRMEKVSQTVGYTDAGDPSVVNEDLEEEAQKSQRYVDVEIPDLCKKVVDYIPNMSEGALIALNRHCLRWHSAVEDILDNCGYYTNESLTEDVDVPTLTGPEEGPKSGVAALINEAIQEELKTVQMYNDIAVTARAEGFEDIAGQIDEINTEENKHIGQLQEVLKTVAPNAQAIDAGELEAGDDIVNVSENTNNPDETLNTNIKEDVSMGKERWEDIYNSFKTVEKELNQDGEAVTAVVDKMYQDNKDDPDYKKAYDKWAAGE